MKKVVAYIFGAYALFWVTVAVPALLFGTTITVATTLVRTGRGVEAIEVPLTLRPTQLKLLPGYWFDNDDVSAVGNTWWYAYFRNPLHNFRAYVIGIADRPHRVTGFFGNEYWQIPNKRSDLRPVETGLQMSVCWVFGLPLLPWVSVSYAHFTAYAGWEPGGQFGLLLNTSNHEIKNSDAVLEEYYRLYPERRKL